MDNQLKIINDTVRKVTQYLATVIGTKDMPMEIIDDKGVKVVQDNLITIRDATKTIKAHFDPIKKTARAPYDKALADERVWLDALGKLTDYCESKLSTFFDAERKRQLIARQAQYEAEQALLTASDTVSDAVIVPDAPETKFKSRSDTSIVSESNCIKSSEIINHCTLAATMIGMGLGNMLFLDKKTITAINKWLVANPSIDQIDGYNFTRGYDINLTKRK